ncbi:MAG: DUF3429 domain-containing protein [Pseudomonadota bacterium]
MEQRQELNILGLSGVIPFAFGAACICASPFVVSVEIADWAYKVTLVYGAIIASYMSGMGAGAIVGGNSRRAALLPGMIAALIAWVAAWPDMPFIGFTPSLRYVALSLVLIYLLIRDNKAIDAGDFPGWYRPLRWRLTVLACTSLLIAAARMSLSS